MLYNSGLHRGLMSPLLGVWVIAAAAAAAAVHPLL
jgi:hypothetical protein